MQTNLNEFYMKICMKVFCETGSEGKIFKKSSSVNAKMSYKIV